MKYRVLSSLLSFLLITVGHFGQAQKLSWKEKRVKKNVVHSVSYLASDPLMGRSTGSNGELKSAKYIAEQFEKFGLIPKGDEGFFQTFSITSLRIADASSKAIINGKPITLFSDYYPLSYSSNMAGADGPIMDVGFGISTEKRDDYKGKDLKGRVALINISSPDGIHPHSEWLAWHGINIRVDEAIKHGAKAVIFYRDNEKVDRAESELSLKMKPSEVPVIFLTKPLGNTDSLQLASLEIKIITDTEEGHNVIGFKDNGANTTVVIGAHHDHLGTGEHGNSLGENPNEIHNGADDNASGVAAMIELARLLKKSKGWNNQNNYLFIAFSGEELGLVGSKHFTENPTIDLKTVNYMINMDMVGMLDKEDKDLIINGVGTGSFWKESIKRLEEKKRGIGEIHTTEGGIGPSDHTSFYLKTIPAIHFFTGTHEHYHKPSDDVENLNFEGEVFVICYILNMIKDLNDLGKQQFQSTLEADSANQRTQRSKFSVTLGIVPDYTFGGEGLHVDAVREGKPGALAGLKAGDVIISFADHKIASMGDYMEVLGILKEGDKADLQVRRDGKVLNLQVQF